MVKHWSVIVSLAVTEKQYIGKSQCVFTTIFLNTSTLILLAHILKNVSILNQTQLKTGIL